MVFFRTEREPDHSVEESPRSRAGSGSGAPLEPSPCVNATRNEFFHRLERVQRGDETGGVREHVAAPPPPISPIAADCAAAVPMPPPIECCVTQSVEDEDDDEDEDAVDPELGAPLLVSGQPAPPTRSFLRGGLSMELSGLTSFR